MAAATPATAAAGVPPGHRTVRGPHSRGGRVTRVLEEEVDGGSGTQKIVYQNWRDSLSPPVNFIFSRPDVPTGGGGGRDALQWGGGTPLYTPPPCDIPSGCCFFTGPWTVTRSSLRMLRRVAAFCRPLRPYPPPPTLQGAQPLPSHCLPHAKRQLQWHL